MLAVYLVIQCEHFVCWRYYAFCFPFTHAVYSHQRLSSQHRTHHFVCLQRSLYTDSVLVDLGIDHFSLGAQAICEPLKICHGRSQIIEFWIGSFGDRNFVGGRQGATPRPDSDYTECSLAGLRTNYSTDFFHKIRWKGGHRPGKNQLDLVVMRFTSRYG